MEGRTGRAFGGSLALGKLLDTVKIDGEDSGAIVGEKGGEGTSDDLRSVVEDEGRFSKRPVAIRSVLSCTTHRLMTVMVRPNAREP